MDFASLSAEQQLFCNTALSGANVRVEACIGSGKTTAIQALCDLFPTNKLILYLTYNKLLKVDAKSKIKNSNVTVTNYHGFVYPYLVRNNIQCGISDSISVFTKNRLSIPRYDILIIDEYQDIELDFSEMLEYIKSTNPNMQIIMVGDMSQKIYDKTTLDVAKWSESFLENHVELEFTQCFRLQPELAAKLGNIWGKSIIGVNDTCSVKTMGKTDIIAHLSKQKPGDILCLGAKTGPMTDVLNILEDKFPDKFNKNTVYASIRDGGATIEPDDTTAIFTTFDSSKGMEKPVCIVFDWDEAYWSIRSRQPDVNYEILRNIFCVAASRGKREIIFATCSKRGKKNMLLSEKTLMTPVKTKPLTEAYTNDMFDFKFVEEINKAYKMLDIVRINTAISEIDVNDADGYIDLSPCISEYQKMMFFKNYNIDRMIENVLEQRDRKVDTSALMPEQKLLFLVSLITKQNRYCNQVRTPFVNVSQHNEIITRLTERLSRDEEVQKSKSIVLEGITIHDQCDVIQTDTAWQIEFKHSLCPQDFLRAAMHTLIFNKRECMLWNTRTNELYRVCVENKKQDVFLKQVHHIITKQKSADTLLPNKTSNGPKNKSAKTYHQNDKINHKRFGQGIVKSVKYSSGSQILDILFDNGEYRQILSDYVF